MKTYAHLLLFGWILLLSLAGAPAAADENQPRLRAKGCAKLTVRRVEERGRVVYLSTGDEDWVFSAQPLYMQLDPEPRGAASPGASQDDSGMLRIEAQPDGTVRWFARDSGAERLAVCLDETHRQKYREWTAFTKSGYYHGSTQAGRMVGWEVPGPENTLDFFPLELLKQTFHRSAVVSRVLTSDQSDTEIAKTLYGPDMLPPADIRLSLPPVLQVLAPTGEYFTKEKRLTVKVRVRSPSGRSMKILANSASGGPQQIDVPFNANAAATAGPTAAAEAVKDAGGDHSDGDPQVRLRDYRQKPRLPGQEVSFTINIPATDSIVQLRAQSIDGENRPGPTTEPVNLQIRWRGGKETMDKPNVYLLAVGVSEYRDPSLRLDYPKKDAEDFAAAFSAQQGKSYAEVVPVVLTDKAATRERVLEELQRFEQLDLQENDLAVVFLAGHGDGNDETGRYHFLPYDALLAKPERTMIEAKELQRILSNRRGGRLLFFIDTCHAGSVVVGAGSLKELADEIAHDANIVVFTSSTGGQVSREWKRWGNGAFTKAVVEGLKGDADSDGTGFVTISMLDYYVSKRVKDLTQEQQTPTTVKPGSLPDFDIAKVYVPPWRRRWVKWTTGSLLVGALIAGSIVFGTQYHPDYQRGNTGWLVQF